jgi:hypothetical protein
MRSRSVGYPLYVLYYVDCRYDRCWIGPLETLCVWYVMVMTCVGTGADRSGFLRCVINLLAPEFCFLILAHPVCKM